MKITVAVLLTFCLLSVNARSQASLPEFEVASVKPAAPGAHGVRVGFLTGGRLNAENVPVKLLIRLAYDVKDSQVSGGPAWLDSDAYDITAKAGGQASAESMKLMLRTLLAERFKLNVRHEMKDMQVYELVPARGGIKVAAADRNCVTPEAGKSMQTPRPGEKPPTLCGAMRMGRGLLDGTGVPMDRLLMALSDLTGRPVIDKTGVSGTFDVHLSFTPEPGTSGGLSGHDGSTDGQIVDSGAPSLFSAVQEQLGLKLESGRAKVEMLVIDHLERPSEN